MLWLEVCRHFCQSYVSITKHLHQNFWNLTWGLQNIYRNLTQCLQKLSDFTYAQLMFCKPYVRFQQFYCKRFIILHPFSWHLRTLQVSIIKCHLLKCKRFSFCGHDLDIIVAQCHLKLKRKYKISSKCNFWPKHKFFAIKTDWIESLSIKEFL